jgi:hypothetical protein
VVTKGTVGSSSTGCTAASATGVIDSDSGWREFIFGFGN